MVCARELFDLGTNQKAYTSQFNVEIYIYAHLQPFAEAFSHFVVEPTLNSTENQPPESVSQVVVVARTLHRL